MVGPIWCIFSFGISPSSTFGLIVTLGFTVRLGGRQLAEGIGVMPIIISSPVEPEFAVSRFCVAAANYLSV